MEAVPLDRFRIAVRGITAASAASGFQYHAVAGRDDLTPHATQIGTVLDVNAGWLARPAALAAAWRVPDAVEHLGHGKSFARCVGEFHDLPDATTVFTGAP